MKQIKDLTARRARAPAQLIFIYALSVCACAEERPAQRTQDSQEEIDQAREDSPPPRLDEFAPDSGPDLGPDLGLDLGLDLGPDSGPDQFIDPPILTPEELEGRCAPLPPEDPLIYVDPFIGTGGVFSATSNVSPGASAPFGKTLLGPDTKAERGLLPFYHWAGYHYDDEYIYGFSHTHAHGMGVGDYGGVAFMPVSGWRESYRSEEGRQLQFSHSDELATPGRYEVTFSSVDLSVSCVASLRGGLSHITWGAGETPTLIFDLGHTLPGIEILDASASVSLGTGELSGYQRLSGSYSSRFGGVQQFFYATLEPAPLSSGGWLDSESPSSPDLTAVDGSSAGLWLTFPEGTREVTLRMALSTTDLEGARLNHQAELAGVGQETLLAQVEAQWRDLLGRVRVSSSDSAQRRTFYTALYHSALMPSRHDDVDGRYRGVDQEIHTADFNYYSDLSLWDTFRTSHPLYTLIWPDVQRDTLRSLLRMYRDGGSLPRWPLAHGYTSGMVGTPAIQLLAESWQKGVQDFDVELAYEAARRHATEQMPDASRTRVEENDALGYLSDESTSGSVSHVLENAWSDHALSLWAEALGRTEDATYFATRSRRWENLWNPDAGFFTARQRDGTFVWSGDEFSWERAYVEGNAWHYLWYIPYDIDAMIDVQHRGDREAWLQRYTDYWRTGVFVEEDDLFPDDWYWHGNEPVLHYAFLGALAGASDLSVEASRWIMRHRYNDTPQGIDGNEDGGTLSAWYIWSALGLYPIAGTSQYAVTSPSFECVELDLQGGRTWRSIAPNTSDDRPYVRRWWIDETLQEDATIDHHSLFGADHILFDMVERPPL